MAAVAQANPKHSPSDQDNGDGTYDVTLYLRDHFWQWNRSPHVIRVDSRFPMNDGEAIYAHPVLVPRTRAMAAPSREGPGHTPRLLPEVEDGDTAMKAHIVTHGAMGLGMEMLVSGQVETHYWPQALSRESYG